MTVSVLLPPYLGQTVLDPGHKTLQPQKSQPNFQQSSSPKLPPPSLFLCNSLSNKSFLGIYQQKRLSLTYKEHRNKMSCFAEWHAQRDAASTYQHLELWQWAPDAAAAGTELPLWRTYQSSALQRGGTPQKKSCFWTVLLKINKLISHRLKIKTPDLEPKSQQRWDGLVSTATAFKAKGSVRYCYESGTVKRPF